MTTTTVTVRLIFNIWWNSRRRNRDLMIDVLRDIYFGVGNCETIFFEPRTIKFGDGSETLFDAMLIQYFRQIFCHCSGNRF